MSPAARARARATACDRAVSSSADRASNPSSATALGSSATVVSSPRRPCGRFVRSLFTVAIVPDGAPGCGPRTTPNRTGDMFGIDGFRFVKMEGLSRFGPCGRSFSRFFCSRTTAFQSGKVSILPPASHQMLAHLICSHSALPKSCLFGNPIQRGRRHSSRSRAEGMVTQRKGSSSPARPRPGAIGKTSPDSSPIGASPTRLMRIVHLCPILVGSARDRSPL